MPSPMSSRALLDRCQTGSSPAPATALPIFDPATGCAITQVDTSSLEDCLQAVDDASAALHEWRAWAPRRRGEVLRRAYELMTAEADAFAALITLENGKPRAEASAEVAYAADFLRWFSEEAVRIDGDFTRAPAGDQWTLVTHEPIGVALLVTPWNFPAAMITRKLGPALAAGCTAIVKPAEDTPLTAIAIAELLSRAGAPPGVVNVVLPVPPAPAVEALLGDPRVRKLSFTGSTAVGRSLLGLAAARVVSSSMELGGNAPFIVLDDVDVDAAVGAAVKAKMRNGGAACTAANRFLVASRVAEPFTAGLAVAFDQLRMGPGDAPGTTLGPMINDAQRRRVDELVHAALDDGAALRCGGHPLDGPGWFYPPTIVTGVRDEHALAQQEVFGPVASILTFDDDDEAITRANATEMGLAAYVCAGDTGRALRVAHALEAGMVGVNGARVSEPAAPFGGMKQSGLGREGAHEGVFEFCETKFIAADWG
jgi:succinate-semialdehyde dehydrogenase / glutarate-semialdehyde dehydrogenase